jgi:hypothetical protein
MGDSMILITLKQALEALEYVWGSEYTGTKALKKSKLAIDALRQSIEQAEQAEKAQPKCGAIIEVFGKDWRLEYMSLPVGKHKLYTQQYEYIAPPQRKPLTDEEIAKIASTPCAVVGSYVHTFARAIEAAHGIKEKNT